MTKNPTSIYWDHRATDILMAKTIWNSEKENTMTKLIEMTQTVMGVLFALALAMAIVWADFYAHGTARFTDILVWVVVANAALGMLFLIENKTKGDK